MVLIKSAYKIAAFCVVFLSLYIASCDTPKKSFQCTDSIGCVVIGPGEPLKIGVLQSLSGKVSSIGEGQVRGISMALDERQGKVAGRSVVLQTEDTGCSAEGGANAALKIIADPDQLAILGTTCSGAAATASKAMSEAGLTMVSGNNSAPFLTAISNKRAPSWQSGFFRTASNEENAGRAAALYAYKTLKISKAATINDGDIYTRGLTDGFIKAFQDLGGEVVLYTSINKGDTEMLPVLTAVLNAQAQFLFFPLFQPEGNHILLQASKTPAFKDIILMSDGALIDSSFLEAVGDNAKGMYFIGPTKPTGPACDELDKKYKLKYKSVPSTSYYLSAYDAANLLFGAIEKVAVLDQDGSLHIGRQALRDALYNTKDFKGVTGNLTCDEFGDCAQPKFNVLRFDNPSAGVEGLQSNVIFSYSPQKQ